MRVSLDAAAGLDSHQGLAASVIKQALTDLGDGSPDVAQEAHRFLMGSSELQFWCDVAGLHIEAIMSHAGALLRPEPRSGKRRAA